MTHLTSNLRRGMAGGLVVLEGVVDLAAGQPAGMVVQGGVDLFGERVAGCRVECLGGGAGGVVPDRECCLEVLGLDLVGAVEQRVDEREANGVRF